MHEQAKTSGFHPPGPTLLDSALTLYFHGGRTLSITGITHIHTLIPGLTVMNDQTPASALGHDTYCLAGLKLHAIL